MQIFIYNVNFVKHTTSDSECEFVNRVHVYVVVQIKALR